MPFAIATLDGLPMFGLVTESTATHKPPARQRTSYAGTDGELDVFLGRRGWRFTISGVIAANDIPSIQNSFAAIFALEGPGVHTYTDTKGNSFPNVVFDGELTPDPKGPHPTDTGWCQAYTMAMESLL